MSTPEINSQQINAKDLFMVLIVTVSWGLNYPVMKFVVNSYPPSAFRAFTFLIGCMAIGAYVRFKGISIGVPKHEIRPLFKLSLFNMVGWHLPMIYGVSMLNSGRAAIIGYTMPVWALLASSLLYREKITITALLGIALAMSAALLLAWGSAE
jgi:drug/metabolite transporter (DMT)-like permease